ncbi:MAG: transcriptional repressor [Phycisphaerales bacterium]|nr:MAG: transcriptional repressor [Phycisphaerales bacterium]
MRSLKITLPQRNTRQRDVILQELCRLTSHPTATDLYDIVRRRLPRISLGTVYRNLDQLAEAGMIRRLEAGGGQARFDGNIEPHHHVRCIHCGRVGDVHDVPTLPGAGDVAAADGYEIISCRVEFLGVCPECREEPASGGGRDRVDRGGRMSRDG